MPSLPRSGLVLLPLSIALSGVSRALGAQAVELQVHAGVRAPLAGALTVPVPEAAQVGFVSIPRKFEESIGTIVGVALRTPATSPLALRSGISATFSSLRADAAGIATCDPCATRLVGGSLAASLRRDLSDRLLIDGAIGGELLHLGGAAYAQPLVVRGNEVVPNRRTLPAAIGSVGARYRLPRRGTLSIDLQARRYHVRARWAEPSLNTTAGVVTATPSTDLLVNFGWIPGAR